MGIPYSREINAAFDQVTPLVAEGFVVLQTTKNISILLAIIQVLTVLMLGLIFAVSVAILISVNPDLEDERRVLVTPLAKWFIHRVPEVLGRAVYIYAVGFCFFVVGFAGYAAREKKKREETPLREDAADALEELGEGEKEKKGKKQGKKK